MTMNKWESQGVGKAPFRCVGMFKMPNKDTATMQDYAALPQGYGAGSCHVCGTGIIYNYMIHDADGQKFVVGCECVNYTNDTTLIDAVKAERKAFNNAQKAAETRKRNEEERARNGGLTDKEMAQKAVQDEWDAKRKVYRETNKELFDAGLATGYEWIEEIIESCIHYCSMSDAQKTAIENGIADFEFKKNQLNEFFGAVGDRVKKVELTTTFEMCVKQAQYYGDYDVYLAVLIDSEGRTYKYMGSSLKSIPTKGNTAVMSFSIKAHEEYKGVNQTVIQRPKMHD
ncbi:hypothetical protein [Aeromonas phage AS-sw]|uniref:Uncharacterized protein n=2 Tax=Ceceduovirus TaxID=2842588 RepID=A0A291LD24_9CAUD|nr:hypothetical protein HWB29_gp086 [Aeromonas phage AS-sw]ATI17299.1 hypothetical protein [Aeromonas phage AS-szw]ATI18136.1 hypothetical protein [Aeromonas phage AS-sw]